MSYKLEDMLIIETTKVVDDAKNWESIVDLGGELLKNREIIDYEYIQAIKNAVKKYGPYMVLKDFFALMHARPEDGVKDTGMALILSKNPINMEGKLVKLFLILAAKDNNSHIESLSTITENLMDDGLFDSILNSKDNKELLSYIKGGEK